MMAERAAMAGGWCRVETNEPAPGTTVVAWTPGSSNGGQPAEGSAGDDQGARDAADPRSDR